MIEWKSLVGVVAAGVFVGGAAPVGAHHSTTMYDRNKPITVEAEVKEFRWLNPHVTLTVVDRAPKPGTAPQTWVIEMSSPGVLTRSGWTKRTFNPGDRIAVEFGPLRSGAPGGLFIKATQADGNVVTYSMEPGEQ